MIGLIKKSYLFIKTYIRNMKLNQKIITIYIIGGLLPQIILAISLTNGTKKIVIDQTKVSERTELSAMSIRIVEVMRILSDVSLRMYFDEDLEKIALTKYTDYYENVADYNNFDTIKNYIDYYGREIQTIRLYIDNDTIANNSTFMKVNEVIRNQTWYQDTINKKGLGIWNYLYNNITKESYLTLTRTIRTKNKENIAIVSIAMKDSQIHSLLDARKNETLVVLNDATLVASNDSSTKEEDIIPLLTEYRNNINDMVIYKNQEYLMTVEEVKYAKTDSFATIVSLKPYKTILKAANSKAMEGIVFILISLILSACLIIYFSYKFTKRVHLFHRQMHKAAGGDFDMSIHLYGKDEIGELYDDLCSMIHSIQHLMDTVYYESIQKEKLRTRQKEVEFKMLASQINPHFLYNTLETIRMKARVNGEYEIEEIVKMLAKIMRRNIEVGDKLVTLKYEIELVEYYLKIQKYRFGDKITYEIITRCDISKYKIIPLIIQPIVENAFVHGLESKEGNGKITITIEEDESLMIQVEDDGIGIEVEVLCGLTQELNNVEEMDRTSIGLSNVNQRIKLLYGEEYGLYITSTVQIGTRVDIKLPKGIGKEKL